MESFLQGFLTLMQPSYMLLMIAGVILGEILGALPGLTGGLGIALMLPFTYRMDPLPALTLLMAIYSGGLFGGSITAIAINTPGAPPNIYTVLDGYPMFRNGRGGEALGLALMSSTIGGVIGTIILVLICEPMANFALRFGPGEMFMLLFFGISCVGAMEEKPLKSMFSGLFGVLLGTIGVSTTGALRGTYGSIYLLDGLPQVPLLIGLVALPNVFSLAQKTSVKYVIDKSSIGFRAVLRGCKEVLRHPIQVISCALLGTFIGVVPAAGSPVAAGLSYNQCKQWMKKGKEFGTGVPEGVIACETANNASEGGALATMFVLGIPGSRATAVMLSALIIQGWAPGPKLFLDNKEIIYQAFSTLLASQFIMLLVGIALCVTASHIIKIPNKYLVPTILALTLIGAFASRYLVFDIFVMLIFAIVGLAMKKSEFPVMPMVLGLLLGKEADANCIRITQAYDSFWEIFHSPITVVLTVVALFCLFYPLVLQFKNYATQKKAK